MEIHDYEAVRECTLSDLNFAESFLFKGNTVLWNVLYVSKYSIIVESLKSHRVTELSFDEKYKSKSLFNSVKADRKVVVYEPKGYDPSVKIKLVAP